VLSKDDILKCKVLEQETVPVPEWGGEVTVREMTGAERDAWECAIHHGGVKNFDNIRARLAAISIVDDDGNKVFTLASIEELGELSGKALDRIFGVAKRLSGIGNKEIGLLKKNLKITR
jgi:hypothetical protein